MKSILWSISGTLMLVTAVVLEGIPNPAWPLSAAAGICFYLAGIQGYLASRRKKAGKSDDESQA